MWHYPQLSWIHLSYNILLCLQCFYLLVGEDNEDIAQRTLHQINIIPLSPFKYCRHNVYCAFYYANGADLGCSFVYFRIICEGFFLPYFTSGQILFG